MKMVKSLLLGTAAGFVAIAGAQAADLPVKAKPVQYVKICSLYGAGFYYIPGTDMCLKVGGWVRFEAAYHVNGSSVTTQNGDVNNRNTNNTWWRERGYITADARNQTEYGTVRAYIAIGLSTNDTGNGSTNSANQFDANRAMIQWAGFTFGRTQSFYDFYNAAAQGFFGFTPGSDTGDAGQNLAAYTAQFGNGVSATLSVEDRRMTQIVNAGAGGAGVLTGVITGGSFSTSGSTNTSFGAYGGNNVPDIVGNLRVDQAWGSAQVMGVAHEVNSGYYTAALEPSGGPSDTWGYVVGAGIKLNAPMIGQGDYLDTQVNYTHGALRYLFQNPGSGNPYIQNGGSAAYGVMADAVYGGAGATGTNLELTNAWEFNAHYEHIWNPHWQSSLYGGYGKVSYGTSANAMLCVSEGFGGGGGNTATATPGCNNDWSMWWVGSRTQFNIDSSTYLGLDIAYQNVQSASTPTGLVGGNRPSSTAAVPISVSNEGNWLARFRVHRNFYP